MYLLHIRKILLYFEREDDRSLTIIVLLLINVPSDNKLC